MKCKVTKKEEVKFKPVELTITIESERELIEFARIIKRASNNNDLIWQGYKTIHNTLTSIASTMEIKL